MCSRVSAQTPPPFPSTLQPFPVNVSRLTPAPSPPSTCSQFAVKVSGLTPPPHPPSACEPAHHSEQSQRAQALLLKQKNSRLAIASFRDCRTSRALLRSTISEALDLLIVLFPAESKECQQAWQLLGRRARASSPGSRVAMVVAAVQTCKAFGTSASMGRVLKGAGF